jgi:hypothetical protein
MQRWSADPSHYSPRCHHCHVKFDGAGRRRQSRERAQERYRRVRESAGRHGRGHWSNPSIAHQHNRSSEHVFKRAAQQAKTISRQPSLARARQRSTVCCPRARCTMPTCGPPAAAASRSSPWTSTSAPRRPASGSPSSCVSSGWPSCARTGRRAGVGCAGRWRRPRPATCSRWPPAGSGGHAPAIGRS